MELTKGKLNAYQLKIIAVIAMFLDHIVKLIPVHTTVGYVGLVVLNMIGRLTMPIMCFFIAEGYYHTKNLKKYFLRLFVFAIISQIPFYIHSIDKLPDSLWHFITGNIHLNVIYTLFMGLLALTIAKSEKINIVLKIVLMYITVMLTYYSDWRLYGVIWVLIFGLFRGDFKTQVVLFILIAVLRCRESLFSGNILNFVIQMCTVFALPLIYLYNGKQGKKLKYGFYIFYPVHLLILGLINLYIILK